MAEDLITREMIEAAAAALANIRGGRRGMPEVANVLDMLPKHLRDELVEDAKAALHAALITGGDDE